MRVPDEQLTIALDSLTSIGDGLSSSVLRALAPAVPTQVFLTYWRFASERQAIFFRRLQRDVPPWTDDPIIQRHKFTNAYRASDRVSQFLIRHVIYGSLYSDLQEPSEVVFRVLLFKFFNRIETWQRLESHLGPLTLSSYDYRVYDAILSRALENGERLYSAAYIMPAAPRPAGETRKHRSHLLLLAFMLQDAVAERLQDAATMQAAFHLLRGYPSLGDFLAYQFITDLNYAPFLRFSEMEFVVPGPGALDGLSKCFTSLGGLTEIEAIRLVTDLQEVLFEELGLDFLSLWGRRLQLIDCQNLFCEVSKYARLFHPEVGGLSGRTRIKQQFRSMGEIKDVWYPPKWGLNERIAQAPTGTAAPAVDGPDPTGRR